MDEQPTVPPKESSAPPPIPQSMEAPRPEGTYTDGLTGAAAYESPGVTHAAPGVVPPQVFGSPAEMGPPALDALSPEFVTMFDGTTPWWRPGVGDVAKVIGWRWVLVVPLLAVVLGLPVSMMFLPRQFTSMIGPEIKFISLAFAALFSIVVWAIKNVVRSRRDYFCIHCGYTLDGHDETGICPECGRAFSRGMINEYRKDPHFFVDRWRALKDAPKGGSFAAAEHPTPDDGTG